MGFFGNLFGGKSSGRSDTSGSMSMLQMAVKQNLQLEPAQCDICRTTFLAPKQRVVLSSDNMGRWKCDVGGYCRQCRRNICATHARLAPVDVAHAGTLAKMAAAGMAWAASCETCGTELTAGASSPSDEVLMLVDITKLGKPEPAPWEGRVPTSEIARKANASLGRRKCTICGDFYLHFPGVLAVRRNVGMEKITEKNFVVDTGGHCPTCGDVCPKHAEVKLVSSQGQPTFTVWCKKHHQPLTGE